MFLKSSRPTNFDNLRQETGNKMRPTVKKRSTWSSFFPNGVALMLVPRRDWEVLRRNFQKFLFLDKEKKYTLTVWTVVAANWGPCFRQLQQLRWSSQLQQLRWSSQLQQLRLSSQLLKLTVMEAVVIPAFIGLSVTAYFVRKFGTGHEAKNKTVRFS